MNRIIRKFIHAVKEALAERRFLLTVLRFFFIKIPVRIKNVFLRLLTKADTVLALPYLYFIRKTTKIDPRTIVLITSRGAYDCNPKAICEEIRRQNLPYELIWVTRKNNVEGEATFPPGIKTVYRDSYEFHKACAKAAVIIDNSVNLSFMLYKKKPGQTLIETWHGAIGIKKFSKDANHDRVWVRKAEKQGAETDYCLSNSAFETRLFKDTFWPNAEILRYGHARNDVLFLPNDRAAALENKIRAQYDIPENKRICLYAPTFRDDMDDSPYRIPYRRLLAALSERFGGEWVILTRYHLLARKRLTNLSLPPEVINVSDYPDIQELMRITDVGVTDYSSWICEYMLTGRPGFLFATDAAAYVKNERALFFPLNSMPFPLAENSEQLIDNILRFDENRFAADCKAFLARHGSVDDGHAAARAVEKIKEITGLGDAQKSAVSSQ